MKAAELEFLRFYYQISKEWFAAAAGTDECYWIKAEFEERTGKDLPEGYEDE